MLQVSAVVLMTDDFCIACNHPQLTCFSTCSLTQFADRKAMYLCLQVVACLRHRPWPDAWHSLQRCLSDGGTLC